MSRVGTFRLATIEIAGGLLRRNELPEPACPPVAELNAIGLQLDETPSSPSVDRPSNSEGFFAGRVRVAADCGNADITAD
jgi:hypothetical protein